ncbi:alanyl-tRNA editing protein [uncultured Roseobacter sp.]|uniref:alanyl-tRNA editing protein n=1 Tax=uncultured Roseobacter sp. TaxID=114847 RepID=UPI00262267AB|nr:alanyl-tRNA editing protein [uncultured Roseobacter sp.]
MTQMLFRDDPYLQAARAQVVAHTDAGGLVLARTVFYPTGGGQPGDAGHLTWPGGALEIATTVKGEGDAIVLVPADGQALPAVGAEVEQTLDWDRRYRHMRIHTALHLLSVAIPFGVTGGAISAERGRLDFDMPELPEDKEGLQERLNAMIASDAPVSEDWITEAELDAQPDLVKTMSVQPPRGAGRIRLIRIGDVASPLDLQPCGGTHVARLGEIGTVRLGKMEKKGRRNRRIYLHLDS